MCERRRGGLCVSGATVAGLHAGVPDGGVLHRQPRQQQVTCEGSRPALLQLRHTDTLTHLHTAANLGFFLFFSFLQVCRSLAFEIIKG